MKISRNENVLCPWCSSLNKLGVWNDLTYSKCTNREMKRAFTPLTDSKAFGKNQDSYYLCPDCGRWSRGNQLSIKDTDNEYLLKLGGQPIIINHSRK